MKPLKSVRKLVWDLNHKKEEDKYLVKDYFTENELKYYADIDLILEALEPYEINIPKKYYEKDKYDFNNGAIDYLEDLTGIDRNDFGNGDNTYNHAGRVLNDINWQSVETGDGTTYVAASIHISGDIRGNYTECFVLKFEHYTDFYEVVEDMCNYKMGFTLEIDGNEFNCDVSPFQECLRVWCPTLDTEIYGIYGINDEEVTRQIREKVSELNEQ